LSIREKTSAERKAEPIYSGVLMYFPDALAAVCRVSKAGNDKHNPGEPMHWARGKSTDQMDCAVRHILTPEVIDPETGEPELAAAAWRILAQLQLIEENRNKEKGVKSYSGI
jgi:dATP/dGTP diphosphohydrolase